MTDTAMYISREEYDRQPLLIRQGAIELWGVFLARSVDYCRTRYLYSFNSFYVEMCYDNSNGKLTCICSSSRIDLLDRYRL
ncbi:MAG: hypothetical protein EOO39_41020 [Cytophagaceae bacterium]|nr:MAG: hypothetical protein EOO39_41020 [Cytophagaceae bacterium]